MNFKKFIQSEMAITNFTRIGDWSPEAKRQYGFDPRDAAILNSEKGVQKIHRSWSNSKNNFDLYFIRAKYAYKHVEIGEVDPSWVKENLNLDIQPREDAITVIFTNNTGAEKMMATAWTLAHRLGHAIKRDVIFDKYFSKAIIDDFREILKSVYNSYKSKGNDLQELSALAHAVGTMRSAREGNLRNFYEFPYELLAQWIIKGKIQFNPLPRSLFLRKRVVYGRPMNDMLHSRLSDEDFKDWNETLRYHASKYENDLDTAFSGLEGKIFVM
jgi:hypothetical protein